MRKTLLGLLILMSGLAVAAENIPDLLYYRHPWIVQGVLHDHSTGMWAVTTDSGANILLSRPLLHWVVRPRNKTVMLGDGSPVVFRFPRKEKFRVISRNNDTLVLGTYKGIMVVPVSLLPPDDRDPSIDYDEWDSDIFDSDGMPLD